MVETTNATTDNTNKDLDYREVYEYIRGHESFREVVYFDTASTPVPTIGAGLALTKVGDKYLRLLFEAMGCLKSEIKTIIEHIRGKNSDGETVIKYTLSELQALGRITEEKFISDVWKKKGDGGLFDSYYNMAKGKLGTSWTALEKDMKLIAFTLGKNNKYKKAV